MHVMYNKWAYECQCGDHHYDKKNVQVRQTKAYQAKNLNSVKSSSSSPIGKSGIKANGCCVDTLSDPPNTKVWS